MKLATISSNPTVVEYAQGAAQDMTSKVADFLAPTVPVGTAVGHYKEYSSKSRFSLPDTLRSLGGRAVEIGFDATDATYNCQHHALDFPVDILEQIEAEGLENVFQEAADICAEVGSLSHEKRVIDAAIDALGAGTALAIGDADDVIDQLDAITLNIIKAAGYGGLMGVGFLFGAGAWRVVKNHPSVRDRFVSGSSAKFSNPNLNDFGDMLVSKGESMISTLCYDTQPVGKAKALNFLLDGDIVIFARRSNPTRRDPSFMKTFRMRNQWMKPGSYSRDDGRVEVAKFDWSADVKVTNSAAGVRKTVALG